MTSQTRVKLQDDVTAIELLRILWRRKKTVLIAGLVTLVLGICALLLQSPKYEAEGIIQIRASQLVATGGIPIVVGNEATEEDVSNARRVIVSNKALNYVLQTLDLLQDPEFNPYLTPSIIDHFLPADVTPLKERNATLEALREASELTTPDKSSLIVIKVRSEDPIKSAQIATILAEQYLLKHAKDLLESAMFTSAQRQSGEAQETFVKTRLDRLRMVLDSLEYPEELSPQRLEGFLDTLLEVSDLALSSYGLVTSNLDNLSDDLQFVQRSNLQGEVAIGPEKLFAELVSTIAVPSDPIPQKRPLIAFLASLFGLICGSIYVLSQSFSAPRIHTLTDIMKQFDLPIWGTVDHAVPSFEDYRDLRSSILLTKPAGEAQVVLLSSATPQNSLSWVALGLAKSYQAIGKSVLVIDADMRSSALAKEYASTAGGNLTSLLTSNTSLKDTTIDVNGVPLVLGGQGLDEAVEAFSSGVFATLIEKLRAEVDIIVVASAPASEFSDTAVLQTLSDVTLLGVNTGQTLISDIDKSLSRLRSDACHPIGLCTVTHSQKQ